MLTVITIMQHILMTFNKIIWPGDDGNRYKGPIYRAQRRFIGPRWILPLSSDVKVKQHYCAAQIILEASLWIHKH